MKTVVGVFRTRDGADIAARSLIAGGVSYNDVTFLTPRHPEGIDDVPTTEGEAPGMGKAMGAVVGGATGAAAGVVFPAVASLLVPGVGPVLAAGTLGAAVLGLLGAVGGAMAGGAIEDTLTEGLPKDEIYVYADALKNGRSVVIVVADDEGEEEIARQILDASGAESLDAARETWWVGVRDAERSVYRRHGRDFASDEALYRRGFEAALRPGSEGRPFEDLIESLRESHGEAAAEEVFRRGFERGVHYRDSFLHEPQNY